MNLEQFVRRARQGEARAFVELARRFQRLVFGNLGSYV
jgi:hypothetical protein